MKLLITQTELIEATQKGVARAVNEYIAEGKSFKKGDEKDYIKANRKGSRDAEKDIKGPGFKQTSKVHKSEKNYSRKGKTKNGWQQELDEKRDSIMELINAIVEETLEKKLI